jgi:hypothetical protein
MRPARCERRRHDRHPLPAARRLPGRGARMTPRLDGAGPWVGWLLAVAALAGGYATFGRQGLLLAVTAVVFWLLLQFSRALRAVRDAAKAPLGSVRSAVMLNARLKPGLTLARVLALTGSLGIRVETGAEDDDEVWRWEDAGGVRSSLTFRDGRLVRWELRRPEEDAREQRAGSA